MSDEMKKVEAVEAEAAEEQAAPAAEPTMAEIVRDPSAPIISVKKLL